MPPLQCVHFEIAAADVIALHKRMMRDSPLLRDARRRYIANTLIAWVIVTAAFTGLSYALAPNHAAGLRVAAFCLVAYALIGPIYAWRTLTTAAVQKKLDRIIERAIRTGKIPVNPGPAEVRLYNDQLMLIEPSGTLAKSWTAVKSINDAPDGVYFAFTDGTQLRVPTRAFPTPGEKSAFVTTAKDRAGHESA